MNEKKKLRIILVILLSLVLIGTLGYSFLLKVSLLDGLYMTIITISSVGYKEVAPMTDSAKIFSIIIIFFGVGTVGYALTNLLLLIVEGDKNYFWRRRKMESNIAKMNNHYILCGAGETGEVIINEFTKNKTDFVIIEKDVHRYKTFLAQGLNIINGDATEEEVLQMANIKQAKGIISSLPTDVDNVFVVLTARTMNRSLYIISRAIDKHAPDKLKRAGANKTISANEIGGRRMAAQMLRPSVVSFLEIVTSIDDVQLDLQDVIIGKNSEIVGQELKQLRIPDRFGLVVIATKKFGQTNMTLNPKSDLILNSGDVMLVLGNNLQVNELRKIAADSGTRDLE
ncbi:potassium channel protein [Fusibacter bizertensis]|jgi:K+ transport systems, NAD-binding component|uniref:Potassium channel protein n=1 Tax=Fusibacter bizertensis TaxID=1488331 RepID=A0ABT6NCG8_9FIRM|nr:potassium channel protein [Fusibacter bizertensis]MDH8678103.1 potassium channel protein [Fusibacter bizertensis]